MDREPAGSPGVLKLPPPDPAVVYYGYRVWGPNRSYDPSFSGSTAGWIAMSIAMAIG
jgi:hypothetical protein